MRTATVASAMLPPMSPADEQAANEALYDRLLAEHAWLAPAIAEVDMTLVRYFRALSPEEKFEQLRRMGELWEAGRAASERR